MKRNITVKLSEDELIAVCNALDIEYEDYAKYGNYPQETRLLFDLKRRLWQTPEINY